MQTTFSALNPSRSINLIGMYAFYTGCMMLLITATPILRLRTLIPQQEMIWAALAIALLAWLVSGSWAQLVITVCTHDQFLFNLPRSSKSPILTGLVVWISILLSLTLGIDPIVCHGMIAAVWAVVAIALICMALQLGNGRLSRVSPSSVAANDLIILAPLSINQQPHQFRALMALLLGLLTWTSLDIAELSPELWAIALVTMGLVGFCAWQFVIDRKRRTINLELHGIWGMQTSFYVNLYQFSGLTTLKLRELDLEWLQLSNNREVITLPPHFIAEASENDSNLMTILRDYLDLVEHKLSRDLLSTMHILLPQSVGTLAGSTFILLGICLDLLWDVPSQATAPSFLLLTGCCLIISPLAQQMIYVVAPRVMRGDRLDQLPWQIGAALMIIALYSDSHLIPLTLIWLCCGMGGCMITIARRSPLVHRRF